MSIRVGVRISGDREAEAAFERIPKAADDEFRKRTRQLADNLAGTVAGAARGDSAQSALLAPTVRAVGRRSPTIAAGGNRAVGSQSRRSSGQGPTRAYHLLFGSNFGAHVLRQFRPHRASGGNDYWFYSTIERNNPRIMSEWGKVADEVAEEWDRG